MGGRGVYVPYGLPEDTPTRVVKRPSNNVTMNNSNNFNHMKIPQNVVPTTSFTENFLLNSCLKPFAVHGGWILGGSNLSVFACCGSVSKALKLGGNIGPTGTLESVNRKGYVVKHTGYVRVVGFLSVGIFE